MEKRAAVAQERFAFAGSEPQLKLIKFAPEPQRLSFAFRISNLRRAVSVGTLRAHSRTKAGLDRGKCVVAAASDPIKSF